ncbi:hypothetical protein BC826DRAFT_1021049 [Russula brevipes]|nr:hypothetical protein BC826DRAFT_1021049 [Russula brevipes]
MRIPGGILFIHGVILKVTKSAADPLPIEKREYVHTKSELRPLCRAPQNQTMATPTPVVGWLRPAAVIRGGHMDPWDPLHVIVGQHVI